MKKRVSVFLAVIRGKAIIIAQNSEKENRADVIVGKELSKGFAVSSLVSTLKAMAL